MKGSPFHIADLSPSNSPASTSTSYCEGRSQFTTDEWMDVSAAQRRAGADDVHARRLKLLLSGTADPVRREELQPHRAGPAGTGKSYAFSEFSPYCILISGGKASSANLFYNNARRKVGLVGFWDVVAFDEVGGMKVSDPDVIQIMKDYMANGRFSRGVTQVMADASFVFVGNLNQPVEIVGCQHGHRPVPAAAEGVRPGVDRPPPLLHARLGGSEELERHPDHALWLRHRLPGRSLSPSRQREPTDTAERFFRFGSHVEGRDARAVRRTVSGYLKLLHPDGRFDKEQVREYVELAMEARRRIKEQLKKRHFTEFHKTSFSYIDQETNHEIVVPVPEQSGTGAISQDPLPPGSVYAAAIDSEANVGLYRLEVTVLPGSGKLRTPAAMERQLKESLQRAFAFLQSNQEQDGAGRHNCSKRPGG